MKTLQPDINAEVQNPKASINEHLAALEKNFFSF